MCHGSFLNGALLRPRIFVAALVFLYVVFLCGFSVAKPEYIVFSECIARNMLSNRLSLLHLLLAYAYFSSFSLKTRLDHHRVL